MAIRLRRQILLLGILLLLNAEAMAQTSQPEQANPQAATGRYTTTFAYNPIGQMGPPLVQSQLSEQITGTFLIDTGSSVCVLSRKMAAKLKLHPRTAVGADGQPFSIDGDRQAESVTLPLLRLGSLSLRDVSCIVEDNPLFSSTKSPLDGLIGMNVLVKCAVLFDFQQHQIRLWYPGSLSAQERKSAGMSDAVAIQQASSDAYVSFFSVRFNDQVQENLALDTGAAATVIPSRTAHQLRLSPVGQSEENPTFYGTFRFDAAPVRTLALGSLVLRDYAVYFPKREIQHFAPHIGMDILSKYRVLMDFPEGMLYLQPVAAHSEPANAQSTSSNSAQDARTYSWQYRFKAGETYRTRLKTTVSGQLPNGSPLHNMDNRIGRYSVQAVNAAGEATVVITDEVPTSPGEKKPSESSPQTTITRIYTKGGLIRKQTVENPAPNARQGYESAWLVGNVPVPDKPVKVGDTWQMELDSRVLPNKKVTLVSKLIGAEKINGLDTLKVETKMAIPKDQAETDFVQVNGVYNVDPKQGRLVRAHYTLNNVQAFTPGGNFPIKVTADQELILPDVNDTDDKPSKSAP
jgi:predicted aspartyl protease